MGLALRGDIRFALPAEPTLGDNAPGGERPSVNPLPRWEARRPNPGDMLTWSMADTTLSTLELRWFIRGSVPHEMDAWFPLDAAIERRVDRYLRLDRDDLGVKRRNGGPIEMKLRRSRRPWCLPDGRVAHSEQWTKWRPQGFWIGQGDWHDVVKQVRTVPLSPAGLRTSAPDGITPVCEAELASIEVDGASWWTFALEVSGPAAELHPTLLAVGVGWAWHGPIVDMIGDDPGFGYPAWLLEIDAPFSVSR